MREMRERRGGSLCSGRLDDPFTILALLEHEFAADGAQPDILDVVANRPVSESVSAR